MPPRLNVYALPKLATEEDLHDAAVVVIDVLRASTTMVHALVAGAIEIAPCREVEQARQLAEEYPRAQIVLGGERGGLLIEGFDLGNSPDEYRPETVRNRTVIFTTTNGTQALAHCRGARRVLVGAFVNATAIVDALLEEENIALVCAGTRGEYSRDDLLVAGLLTQRIQAHSAISHALNAQALTAKENWLHSFALPVAIGAEPLAPERLAAELRDTLGGKNLVSIGLEPDLLTAARLDRYDRVPELDRACFRVR